MAHQFSIEKASVGKPGWKSRQHRHCRQCWRVMRPVVDWRKAEPGEAGVIERYGEPMVVARVCYYGYGPEQLFCSLRCAYRFACKRVTGTESAYQGDLLDAFCELLGAYDQLWADATDDEHGSPDKADPRVAQARTIVAKAGIATKRTACPKPCTSS